MTGGACPIEMSQNSLIWDWAGFTSPLSATQQEEICWIDGGLRDIWQLGRNVILAWSITEDGIDLLHIPYFDLPDLMEPSSAGDAQRMLLSLPTDPGRVSPDGLEDIQKTINCGARHIRFLNYRDNHLELPLLEVLLRRYMILHSQNRAAVLFDIDGFSRYAGLTQVTQLNSLNHSLYKAHQKLATRSVAVDFQRSTTGDGFYVWNREDSLEANVGLYHLMHAALADNAVGRIKATGHSTPSLRTCFHLGGFYEMFQPELLTPTTYSYIVGDVTIALERLITKSMPGQILVGDFNLKIKPDDPLDRPAINPVEFVEWLQGSLSRMEGMVLGGEEIDSIECYLTGDSEADGTYNVKKYAVSDKHGRIYHAYNAKISVNRRNASPIWLGIQNKDVQLEVARTVPVG